MKTLGFIGVGNMGSALIKGMSSSIEMSEVLAYGHHLDKLNAFADELGFAVAESASQVASECEFVVIGVQPYRIDGLLEEIAPALKEASDAGRAPVVCSIAAGYSIADFEKALAGYGLELPVVRIMPNSGVAIHKGICLFVANDLVSEEQLDQLMAHFAGTGLCESVSENILSASIPVFSCSPAYVYIFIESLADAGVELGLERDLAMRLAKQAVYGTSAYAIESGKHVAQLREELATPGGMTITSTNYMEKLGFRASVIGGVLKAHERSKNMR